MHDVFGSFNAEIASEILKKSQGFSENEMEWNKEAEMSMNHNSLTYKNYNKNEIESTKKTNRKVLS